jgi:hypothetical protein
MHVQIKKILIFVLLSVSTVSFAATDDPFDAQSCTGPRISNQRALQILGATGVTNLLTPDGAQGVARQRFVVGETLGAWTSIQGYKFYSVLGTNGDLQFNLSVFMDTPGSFPVYVGGTGNITCSATATGYACVGDRLWDVTLTDHCVRIHSLKSDPGEQTEHAYLNRF